MNMYMARKNHAGADFAGGARGQPHPRGLQCRACMQTCFTTMASTPQFDCPTKLLYHDQMRRTVKYS